MRIVAAEHKVSYDRINRKVGGIRVTERLYYDDAYLLRFEAVVTASRTEGGNWIALDRTAFYPTSGGQPYDTGEIRWEGESTRVLDVLADRDGIIWHRTERLIPPGTMATGIIDADRRTDHMEQHGGEHMLAGAIWEKLGGTTIGLHLGAEDSSIDVSMPDGRTHLTDDELEMLESLVNRRIRQDAPIRCWFPSQEELSRLPLRKKPTVSEHVRIVAMGDFEMVACGGTHPRSTGRIGLLKIISAMPSKGKIRITFVCGGRAEALFARTFRYAHKAGNVLSCPVEKLASRAGELKAKLAETERRANRFETERIYQAICEHEETESLQDAALSLTFLEESDSRPVNEAVSRYISKDGRALLLSVGERLIFARSRDVDIDMNELIKRVARGGGRIDLASGAGIPQCASVAKKILVTEGKNRKWRKKI